MRDAIVSAYHDTLSKALNANVSYGITCQLHWTQMPTENLRHETGHVIEDGHNDGRSR